MTKILYLCSNRWNSAITEYCLNSADAMHETCEVHLIALEKSPCYERALPLALQGVHTLKSFALSEFFNFRAILKNIAPDAIICFGGPESALAKLALRTVGLKAKLIKFRGQDLNTNLWPKLRTRISDKGFAHIVFPARWLEKKYTANNPGAKNTETILLPTNGKRFFFESEATDGDHTPFLLFVGRFDPIKGYQQLFSYFSSLLKALPPGIARPKLLILGREENLSMQDLIDIAKSNQLELGKNFELRTAFQQDIHRLMSTAVCGFISSLGSEVICRVSQEFLCCGTPIIVSGVGSLDDSLFEANAGISYGKLSEQEIPEKLAQFFEKSAIESLEVRQKRSQRAIQYFGYESHHKHLLNLILTK